MKRFARGIRRIGHTHVYQYPNRPRQTQYSLENLGNPPQVIMNARVNFQQVQVANNLGNAPRLFFNNELTLVRRRDVAKPLVATHIVPDTRFRALQLARYV